MAALWELQWGSGRRWGGFVVPSQNAPFMFFVTAIPKEPKMAA